jgi:signal transduction histidine kinase
MPRADDPFRSFSARRAPRRVRPALAVAGPHREVSMAMIQQELRAPFSRRWPHAALAVGLPLVALLVFAAAAYVERGTHLEEALRRGASIEAELAEWYADVLAFGPVFALAVVGLVLTSLAWLRRARGEQGALLQLGEAAQHAVVESQRRAAAEAMLERVQRTESLSQVALGAVHDLNNLLNVVAGNLELLRSRSGDPWHLKRIDEALAAAQRGEKLLGALLAFATRRPAAPATATRCCRASPTCCARRSGGRPNSSWPSPPRAPGSRSTPCRPSSPCSTWCSTPATRTRRMAG